MQTGEKYGSFVVISKVFKKEVRQPNDCVGRRPAVTLKCAKCGIKKDLTLTVIRQKRSMHCQCSPELYQQRLVAVEKARKTRHASLNRDTTEEDAWFNQLKKEVALAESQKKVRRV